MFNKILGLASVHKNTSQTTLAGNTFFFGIFLIILSLPLVAYLWSVNSYNIDEISDSTIVFSRNSGKAKPPETVRGIYLTAYSAGLEEGRKNIIKRMKEGRINTVVIDIKDYTGYIRYKSNLETVNKYKSEKVHIDDARAVLKEFNEAGIYTIARLSVFQDPALVRARPDLGLHTHAGNVWYDRSGLAWVDPQKKDAWDYNIEIAREAARLGFDEINFDYIRFPSDGNTRNINYSLPEGGSKAGVMSEFFKYISKELSGEVNISIDMFGLVLFYSKEEYDLGIGQRLVDAVDYFDFICPMTYPSHYPGGYLGFNNPAEYPGEIIAYDLRVSRDLFKDNTRATLRPWLQAFNIGAVYGPAKIEAQVKAVENATTTSGWLLWNARNYYPDHIF